MANAIGAAHMTPGTCAARVAVSAGTADALMCMVRTPPWEMNTSAGEVRM